MNKQKNIKKRILVKPKEMTPICVPSELVNVNYKKGITKLMLHIYFYIYGGSIKELYFSTSYFYKWIERKEDIKRIQSYKKKEIEEIIKEWKEIGLVTVLENVTTDAFIIRLEESFYVYGNDKYYKNFVTVYADEVEKILNIDCKDKKEIDSKMILFMFLYLKQYRHLKSGQMFLVCIADDIFSRTKTARVREILELLEEQDLIYYKKAILKKDKYGNFLYTKFQYTLSYERDLKNRVEYYGDEFIKQKLKELGKEDDYE